MNIFDYLIPQTMEHQRKLARGRFQAGLQQPELFQTENMPIPEMVGAYEKGYGIPYPTQQMPSPTAAIEGMTTDPNRQTTIEPPENLPVEYVQPRTAEDMAIRMAGREGRMAAEQQTAGAEYLGQQAGRFQGMFEDFGEDPEDFELGNIGPYQRRDATGPEGDPMVEVPGIGRLPASVAYRYMKDPKGDKDDIMVDPDGPDGPLPAMPSQHAYHYMQEPGAGEDIPPQVKSALSYFQAMAKQQGLDPSKAILLAWRPQLADKIKQSMDPQAKELYDTMAMIVQQYFSNYAGQTGATDPMGIR